jgi:hypothetical protein
MPALPTPSTPSPENPDPALFDQWLEDQGASPKNTAGRLVSPDTHPVEQVLRAWQKRHLGFGETRRRLGKILPLFGLDSEQEAGTREEYGSRLVVDFMTICPAENDPAVHASKAWHCFLRQLAPCQPMLFDPKHNFSPLLSLLSRSGPWARKCPPAFEEGTICRTLDSVLGAASPQARSLCLQALDRDGEYLANRAAREGLTKVALHLLDRWQVPVCQPESGGLSMAELALVSGNGPLLRALRARGVVPDLHRVTWALGRAGWAWADWWGFSPTEGLSLLFVDFTRIPGQRFDALWQEALKRPDAKDLFAFMLWQAIDPNPSRERLGLKDTRLQTLLATVPGFWWTAPMAKPVASDLLSDTAIQKLVAAFPMVGHTVLDCFPEKLRWQVRDILIQKEATTLSGEIPVASPEARLVPSRRL